jgi:hypothetical protein
MQKLAMIAITLAIVTLAIGTLWFDYNGQTAFAQIRIPHVPKPCGIIGHPGLGGQNSYPNGPNGPCNPFG